MLQAVRNEIDIWLVDDRQVKDPALLAQYRQLLNARETGRFERFIFNRNRDQFLVARALVRSVLADILQVDDPASLEFTEDRHGKPALALETTLQFNLSHTNGLLALAVMQKDPVGVDVEYLSRQADIVKLAERYFSRDETRALHELPVDQWNNRFFELWTLKEAYLKACGTGLRTPLHEFSYDLGEGTIGIRFSDNLEDDPAAWDFWQLDVDGEFRLALAVRNQSRTTYLLRLHRGIPLQEFREIELPLLRRS